MLYIGCDFGGSALQARPVLHLDVASGLYDLSCRVFDRWDFGPGCKTLSTRPSIVRSRY